MSYSVVIDPQALKEIDQARRFIEASGHLLNAQRWAAGLYECLASLRQFPRAHAFARENDDFPIELRQINYLSYRVVYTVSDTTVYILHVRHAARQDFGEST